MTIVPNDTEPVLLGRPLQGDGTCRGGYGLSVSDRHGNKCAYCGLDFTQSYESWLHMSVDHVIPRYVIGIGYEPEWVEDLLNHVPCCRTCNEFLNGYRVVAPSAPQTLTGFLNLRDKVFEEKRLKVLPRHQREQERFRSWLSRISPSPESKR